MVSVATITLTMIFPPVILLMLEQVILTLRIPMVKTALVLTPALVYFE